MAEEGQRPDPGPGSNGADVDPGAMALALGGASREAADAFLEDQRSLIADQKDLVRLQARELAHELKLRHWSPQLRHASAILKFALEVSAVAVGLALAVIMGAAVRNAADAGGLVIESFSGPADLAERGLTGQVAAGELLDRLRELKGTIRRPSGRLGEALMARNQSHFALAEFAEAEKYVPDWGRLPLKWGEVLVYAGRKDEAARQFAPAAALDLMPSEKHELQEFFAKRT